MFVKSTASAGLVQETIHNYTHIPIHARLAVITLHDVVDMALPSITGTQLRDVKN